MLNFNRGLFTLEDEFDFELGASAKKKKAVKKKPAAKKAPAKKPPPKAKKAPAKKPAPKPAPKAKAPPKAKPAPKPKAVAPRPAPRPAPKPKAVVPRPAPKVVKKPAPKPAPKPVAKLPAPDGTMATLKARLALPAEPGPSPLAPMAQASPYVPPAMEPPEVLPPEEPAEEETPEEEPAEEEAPEEESSEEEPTEEEPAEESEEEPAEVELGQLVQHVQSTIKPTLKRFPRISLTTASIPAKAQSAVKGTCQCSTKSSNVVRAKLDKKLRSRGYPAGAGDKLLAGIVELTARLDSLARRKAETASKPKAQLAARALNLTRRLPITHPVRCRAVRLMLTCTP